MRRSGGLSGFSISCFAQFADSLFDLARSSVPRYHLPLLVVLLSLACALETVRAQELALTDGWSFGGTGGEQEPRICLDGFGNLYITGSFENSMDIDPGPGSVILTSAGLHDVFVCKFDATGVLQWAGTIGGPGQDVARDIAVNSTGELFLTGAIANTSDLDPGPGVFNLSASSSTAGFICKLDLDGVFQWASLIGGGILSDSRAVSADDSGNLFLAGFFGGTGDFDPGSGVYNLTSAGVVDAFVLSLDTSGAFQWAGSAGGANLDLFTTVSADGVGGAYVAGVFTNTADFDPGVGVFNLTSVGALDIAVCRMNATGSLLWAVSTGGVDSDNVWDLEVSGSDVYVAGDFQATADFDPGAGTLSFTSAGDIDGFVWKLDDTGGVQWVRKYGGVGEDRCLGLALDGAGAVHVGGWFNDTVDFDPGAAVFPLASAGQGDSVVWSLTAEGDFSWAGLLSSPDDDGITDIVLDSMGMVCIAGTFEGSIDLDPSAGVHAETSEGGYDVFVAILEPALNGLPAAGGRGLFVLAAALLFLGLSGMRVARSACK